MKISWKETFQSFVDDLIEHVYQWPPHERTTLSILKLIEHRQRTLGLREFPDYGCYYIQLAQIIDHFLKEATHTSPDLSWFCKFWETNSHGESHSIQNVLITYKQNRVIFKKYVLERNPEKVQHYCQSAITCSRHMFHASPERIETFNLLTGESHIEWSNPNQYVS
ncbi:hypothetical protein EQV77_12590 [Halobacillus fulvus]|nr:hypothetical protein EQV77_12590 [Halobacillus fulvus]